MSFLYGMTIRVASVRFAPRPELSLMRFSAKCLFACLDFAREHNFTNSASTLPRSWLYRRIEKIGAQVIASIDGLGNIVNFAVRIFYWAARPPWRLKLLAQQFYFIGNKSLLIVGLAGVFTGMVMAYQVYF